MRITEIKYDQSEMASVSKLQDFEQVKKEIPKVEDDKNPDYKLNAWQKDILNSALDILENSIHVDNSHPLTREDYYPIDSFDEALIELSFFKTPFFKDQISAAQANLKPEDVLSLFTEQ
jgi:hypothetical protein